MKSQRSVVMFSHRLYSVTYFWSFHNTEDTKTTERFYVTDPKSSGGPPRPPRGYFNILTFSLYMGPLFYGEFADFTILYLYSI
jgi:hypothetical protein